MFKPMHLAAMCFAALLIMATCLWLRKKDGKYIGLFLKILCVVVLTLDPIYWIWEYSTFGFLALGTTLPLYMCSLFEILLPLVAFSKKRGTMWRMALSCICTITMLCGACGFIFNVYLDQYPFYTFIPLRSLLFHLLMMLVPAVLWVNGYYRPKKGDVWLSFIPVLCLVAVAAVVDKVYNWDYCYLNGGDGTPFSHISRFSPLFFPYIIYGGLFALNSFIFYGKYCLKRVVSRITGKKKECSHGQF